MNTSNESSVYYSNKDILQITTTTTNLALGVPINSWVLWLVLTGPAGTMASEFFALNLSACEIVFSLLCLLCIVTRMPIAVYFTAGFMVTGRPVFQSCICVERFMAVVHPVLFLKCKPLRYRAACSAVAWLVIVGASVIHTLLGFFRNDEIINYITLGECLFFMSVMLSCSLAVLRALKRPAPGETSGRERDNGMKRRAFGIICLIMGSFVGTYFIWSVAIVLATQGLLLLTSVALTSYICTFITVVTGFVQPLLYVCQKTGKLPFV